MLLKWLHKIVKHHCHVCFRLSELELYPHHSYLSISLSVWAGLYLFFIIERFLKIFMDAKARRRGENIASGSELQTKVCEDFTITIGWRRFLKRPCLEQCLENFFNVKALVGTFNQEKALVGAFSMIVKYSRTFV